MAKCEKDCDLAKCLLLPFITAERPNSEAADKEGLKVSEVFKDWDAATAIHGKLKKMQEKLIEKEDHATIMVTAFQNWAGNLEENGLMLYAKPEKVSQIQQIIKAAGELDIKVGFGGAYHSWSPLFPEKCTKDSTSIILNMCEVKIDGQKDNEKKLKADRIYLNTKESSVRIAPGVTTGELMEQFLKEDVCFESDVILLGVTYGGVIPTGCHGVGKDQKILADWVTQVKIVNCDGEIRTYPDDLPEGSNKEDFMRAIRMSMGVFGAVIEMTVKVEKMTNVKVDTSYPTVDSLLYGKPPGLLKLLRDYWSVEILWFPFNSLGLKEGILQSLPCVNIWEPKDDEVWVRAINKDKRECETNYIDKLKQRICDTMEHKALGGIVNPVIAKCSLLTPAIMGSSLKTIKEKNPPETTYEPMPFGIHFRYGITLGPVYDMEFGFPLCLEETTDPDNPYKDDETIDHLMEAMKYVVEESKKSSEDSEYPLSTTMELRVIGKSDCLISPASRLGDNDTTTHTAYLEILSFTGTPNYLKFYKDVGRKWMKLGGAPHWCKEWTILEDKDNKETDIFHHVHTFYNQNLVKYCEIFDKCCANAAKREMFMNSTMKKLLDPKFLIKPDSTAD